jgi:hypothetical protein
MMMMMVKEEEEGGDDDDGDEDRSDGDARRWIEVKERRWKKVNGPPVARLGRIGFGGRSLFFLRAGRRNYQMPG